MTQHSVVRTEPFRFFSTLTTRAKSRASTKMADYFSTADSRVGDTHNAGFFSMNKRSIHLQRVRRATNYYEDDYFVV